jgi:hypothetical protein
MDLPQWSSIFLTKSQKLLTQIINNENTKSISIDRQETRLMNQMNPNRFYELTIHIFTVTRFEAIINRHLLDYQSSIIKDSIQLGFMNTIDNFHYLIGHLPFYPNLIDLLIEIDKKSNLIFNSFIAPIIYNWVIINCKQITIIDFIVNKNLRVHFEIIHPHSFNKFVETIAEVSSAIMQVTDLYYVETPRTMNLRYIITSFEKKLDYFEPNDQINRFLISRLKNIAGLDYNLSKLTNPISNLNVNSGVTTTYPKESQERDQIIIWRSEEFSKVLIHELIHYYDLEKGSQLDSHVINYFNISNTYPVFSKELFTELQTWYLYLLIQLSQQSHSATIRSIQSALDAERFYALGNIWKFFDHYQIPDFATFLGQSRQYTLNVNSSILFYYILKAIVLYTASDLVETILDPEQKCQKCQDHLLQEIQSVIYDPNFQRVFQSLHRSSGDRSLKMMGI